MAKFFNGFLVWFVPGLALLIAIVALLFGSAATGPTGMLIASLAMLALIGAVFSSVHHAEVIAHDVGEPFGTLVLTVAVTVIEVALILSIMLAGEGSATLTRDTVFAVLMVVCNGLVGLCIIVGGFRYGEQGFRVPGAISYLIVLMPLATLTLILPAFTTSEIGPYYTRQQLAFVGVATLVLYSVFLYVQTVRHRDFFIPGPLSDQGADPEPAVRATEFWWSSVLLIIALVAVVLLAKSLGKPITQLVQAVDAPIAAVGLFVAILVLLPESVAALRAARRNELQKSLNLALGSSLASIGMTIPTVGALSVALGQPLALGLEPRDIVLVVLTFGVSLATFGSGRTNILPGFVHLVLFATFVFLVFAP